MATPRKSGAPACGLWLRLGPDLAVDILSRDLKQIFFAINGSPYERNMHALEITGDAVDGSFAEAARHLYALARAGGIATIFRGDPQAAKDLGADGVLVADIAMLQQARAIFGDGGISGLACGLSKELSLAAYDAGADFITFGAANKMPDAELMKMWDILTDRPVVIEGPISNDYAAYYVQAGAGFIDAGTYIWNHAKGVMQGTVNMLHAIDLALETKPEATAQ